jgi:lysophospholipase L1-like esterase
VVVGDVLTQGITAGEWDALVAASTATVPLTRGGTGATTATGARTALGLGSAATMTPATIAADPAMTGTYARHRASAGVLLFGDSLTEQNNGAGSVTPAANSGKGYFSWAIYYTRGRLWMQRNAGIGGNTTVQMLARFATDVAAYSPTRVHVFGGANDIAQTGSTITAAQTIANLTAIYNACEALGAKVSTQTIHRTVSMDTVTETDKLAAVNAWIRSESAARGYVCADIAGALLDPATGYTATAYMTDGVHFSQEGAKVAGKVLAEALWPHLGGCVGMPSSVRPEDGNLVPNGAMVGNISGVATNWALLTLSGVPTATYYKIPRVDGIAGEWQVIDFGPGATGEVMFYSRTASPGVVGPGDILEALFEIRTEDVTIDAAGCYIDARLAAEVAIGNIVLDNGYALRAFNDNQPTTPGNGVLRTGRLICPATTDRATISVRINGITSGRVMIGRALLRKVSS